MTNPVEFRVAALRAGLSLKKIAIGLDITYSALNKKMNNVTEFKSSELERLTSMLNLEDKREVFDRIFFADKVDLKSTDTIAS